MRFRSFPFLLTPVLAAMIVVLPWSMPSSAQQFNGQNLGNAPQPATSMEEIVSRFEQPGAPGAGVAVIKDGKIVFLDAFGKSDLERGVDNTIDTPFNLASLSKQITAYSIAMLVNTGIISLNDDIRKYFPEFENLGGIVKVDHLVHHTSGLREYIGMLSLSGYKFADHATNEDVIRMVARHDGLLFAPGERHTYSNTNYTLLAEIVSRATGKTFATWTRENIFDPLEMTNSGFDDGTWSGTLPQAINYTRVENTFENSGIEWNIVGAGGMYSSVVDLAKWVQNLEEGTLGGDAVRELVRQKGRLNDGSEVDYAFGVIHDTDRGLKTLAHGGGAPGVQSGIRIYVENDFVVIVLINTDADVVSMSQMSEQIVDFYLKEELEAASSNLPERRPILFSTEFFESNPEGSFAADPSSYDAYAGTFKLIVPEKYTNDLFLGQLLIVSRDEDRLLMAFGQPPGFPLVAITENRFLVPQLKFEITFHAADSLMATSLTFHLTEDSFGGEPESDFRGIKLDNTPLTERELNRFEGAYYGPSLDTIYHVSVVDGRLVMSHLKNGSTVLDQLTREEFMSNNGVFTSIKFVRDISGVPVKIEMTGFSWGTDAELFRIELPDGL